MRKGLNSANQLKLTEFQMQDTILLSLSYLLVPDTLCDILPQWLMEKTLPPLSF